LPLRRGYHGRVAERLERGGKGGGVPFGEVAFHYAAAGDEAKAASFALAAGQDALSRFSNAEAIKHFAYFLEKTGDTPDSSETRTIALEGLGDAYYANGLFAKALEVFERLADSSTGAVKLRAYRKATDAIFFGTRQWDRFVELVKKAEPYAGSDRLESARISFLKGGAMLGLGKYEDSLKNFEAALRVFEEEYSLPEVARTLTATASTRGGTRIPKVHDQYETTLSYFLR